VHEVRLAELVVVLERLRRRTLSFGLPSARAMPRFVTMRGPIRPVFVSRSSSTCEWYIHKVALPSIGSNGHPAEEHGQPSGNDERQEL